MTVQQDPTYPPEPYHSLQNQSNTRNGQKSAAQGSPSVQYQPESARDGSFDQDTEALLHSTDQSPISSKQESTPRAKTTRDTPKRDFFDVPLTNAGYRTPSIFLVLLGLAALGSLGYLLSVAFVGFTRYGRNLRVNVILMVSDGFGLTSETMARDYVQYLSTSAPNSDAAKRWQFDEFTSTKGLLDGGFGSLPLDELLVGQSHTRSSNSLVTDSAAGATAFSCGKKTYNGAIAIDPETKDPCGTVLEAAKHKNFLTGLVATSRITHATPAAFYAHIVDRDLEEDIAEFLVVDHPLGLQVDYALGGGRCFFLPSSHPDSCRSDDKDLFNLSEKQKHVHYTALKPNLIQSYQQFQDLPEDVDALGTIGLFNKDHLNYEVDRPNLPAEESEPSLKEMTEKSLKTLSKAAEQRGAPGFFLMVEGSRIDMAAHSNDPVAHLQDILAYQETVTEVKKFVDEQNKAGWPTVMISVSDHETGGLSLGTQFNPEVYPDYQWFPDALSNATSSAFMLAQRLADSAPNSDKELRTQLSQHFGLVDPTTDELRSLQESEEVWQLDQVLSQIVSARAELGWSTHGHSGADVSLYARGYKAKNLKGSIDNTEIGKFIADVFEVDIEGTTNLLMRTSKAWHEKDKQAPNNTVGIAHYHGHDALSHGDNSGSATSSHLYLGDNGRRRSATAEQSIP